MKRLIIAFLIIASLFSVLSYLLLDKGQLYQELNSLAVGELEIIEVFEEPKQAPLTPVKNRDGESVTLANYKGKVVLVNFWATWCAPCVHEMPALNRLQKTMGGADFEVITISMDREGYDVIDPFFATAKLDALQSYLDRTGRLTLEVGANGLPTTILLDRKGKIIARAVGPLEWDSKPVMQFLDVAIRN